MSVFLMDLMSEQFERGLRTDGSVSVSVRAERKKRICNDDDDEDEDEDL